jgi:ActR/RegA family two-component response regulator
MPNTTNASKPLVLYVDDEVQALKYFEKAMEGDLRILTAQSADEAESILHTRGSEVSVLISDHRMPARSGASLMASIRLAHPAIVRILTTAYSEIESAIEAVNRGEVFRYILKPWDFESLRQDILTAVQVYHLQSERNLLVGEKLSVHQRMRAVDRAKSLLIAASAFSSLPRASDAVCAYVTHAANISLPIKLNTTGNLDLWTETEAEVDYLKAIVKELGSLRSEIIAQPETASAVQRTWFDTSAEKFLGHELHSQIDVMDFTGSSSLDDRAVKALLKGFANGSSVWLSPVSVLQCRQQHNATNLLLNGTHDEDRPDALLFDPSDGADIGGRTKMLGVYLLVYAIGGCVEMQRFDGTVELSLQLSCPATAIRQYNVGYLQAMFQSFENWG